MEASVATPEVQEPAAPQEPEASYDGEAAATQSAEELFQWSGYAHVGAGAEECEHRIDGACTDKRHFHVWVCLPNTFQIRDIVDKARAAQARKRRTLRDPESDSYAVLEVELEELRRPQVYDKLLKEIASREVDQQLVDLMRELQEDERFEHHAQDAEELRRLQELPEDERDPEEYSRLLADMEAYGEQLQRVVDERENREEERLRAMSQDDVLALEREFRIDNITNEIYLHTYYSWVMYVCARMPSTEEFPSRRMFASPDVMRSAPPEAVMALREKIRSLENRTVERGDATGN